MCRKAHTLGVSGMSWAVLSKKMAYYRMSEVEAKRVSIQALVGISVFGHDRRYHLWWRDWWGNS